VEQAYSINMLPPEILAHIFNFVGNPQTLANVCGHWSAIINGNCGVTNRILSDLAKTTGLLDGATPVVIDMDPEQPPHPKRSTHDQMMALMRSKAQDLRRLPGGSRYVASLRSSNASFVEIMQKMLTWENFASTRATRRKAIRKQNVLIVTSSIGLLTIWLFIIGFSLSDAKDNKEHVFRALIDGGTIMSLVSMLWCCIASCSCVYRLLPISWIRELNELT
jgi:hypothetical protein